MKGNHERLSRIRTLANAAFGEAAETWLNTSWRVFDNRTPIEMASDEGLTQRVVAFLTGLCAGDEAATPAFG